MRNLSNFLNMSKKYTITQTFDKDIGLQLEKISKEKKMTVQEIVRRIIFKQLKKEK